MVLVQNRYKNTRVGVLRTQITFVTHSSPLCYVTLRTQVIRLNSGNLGPQKTDSGVFIIVLSILVGFHMQLYENVDFHCVSVYQADTQKGLGPVSKGILHCAMSTICRKILFETRPWLEP